MCGIQLWDMSYYIVKRIAVFTTDLHEVEER